MVTFLRPGLVGNSDDAASALASKSCKVRLCTTGGDGLSTASEPKLVDIDWASVFLNSLSGSYLSNRNVNRIKGHDRGTNLETTG